MQRSRLPAGGANIFQKIRQKRSDAEAAGLTLLDLSIGEPKGPALRSARQAAQAAVMSDDEAMHAYQYNASPAVPDFSRRFVNAHLDRAMPDGTVDYVPIPGIKPILGLLPLACGCALRDVVVATTTKPGYPSPPIGAPTMSGSRIRRCRSTSRTSSCSRPAISSRQPT